MKGKKPDRWYRPQLETLERRDVPAAAVLLRGGLLRIIGNNLADQVVVTTDANQLRVSQDGRVPDVLFDLNRVNAINFRGFGGNDTFINNTAIRSRAFGEQGRDQLVSGAAIDQFFGGPGIDQLVGDAFDLLNGGPDRDLVFLITPNTPLGTGGLFGTTNLNAFNTSGDLFPALGNFGSGSTVTGPFGSLGSMTTGLTSLTSGLGSFANPIGTGSLSLTNPLTSNQALSSSSAGALGNSLFLGSTFSPLTSPVLSSSSTGAFGSPLFVGSTSSGGFGSFF